jgi:hypothetical protein
MKLDNVSGGLIAALLPLIVVWIIFLFIFNGVRKRKGISFKKYFLRMFPIWGSIYMVWLASLTDIEVKERLGLNT